MHRCYSLHLVPDCVLMRNEHPRSFFQHSVNSYPAYSDDRDVYAGHISANGGAGFGDANHDQSDLNNEAGLG
jgi:hypothetical protein